MNTIVLLVFVSFTLCLGQCFAGNVYRGYPSTASATEQWNNQDAATGQPDSQYATASIGKLNQLNLTNFSYDPSPSQTYWSHINLTLGVNCNSWIVNISIIWNALVYRLLSVSCNSNTTVITRQWTRSNSTLVSFLENVTIITSSSFGFSITVISNGSSPQFGLDYLQLDFFADYCGNGIVTPSEECDRSPNCTQNCTCEVGYRSVDGQCVYTPVYSVSGPSNMTQGFDPASPNNIITFEPSSNNETSVNEETIKNDTVVLSLLLTLGVIIPALAVLLVILLLRRKRLKKKKKSKDQNNDTKTTKHQDIESESTQSMKKPLFDTKYVSLSIDENRVLRQKYSSIPVTKTNETRKSMSNEERLNIPFADLIIKQEIGAGDFGKVYLGEWQKTKVAIKISNTKQEEESFRREATLMVNIRPHPNVLRVWGISTDGPNPAIIMEFCSGGSLDKILFNHSIEISEAYRWRLIAGIARGMYHLHRNNIVHRDLAARNILLSSDGEPKISDFGMSRIILQGQTGTTKTNIGPIRWMAPESLASQVYSTKSDVWSFGIVIWEIIARQEPHLDIDILDVGRLIRDEKYHPKIPEGTDPDIEKILLQCWQPEPADRPEFEKLCEQINEAIERKNL